MNRTLPRLKLAALTVAVAITLLASAIPAYGQATCATREQIVDFLRTQFEETMIAAGVDQSGNLVQVFSSEAGSWTIIVTIPGGPTCLLSAGDGWTFADDRKPTLGGHGA